MEYVFMLIGLGLYALRIAIPIFVARTMLKRDYRKWQIAVGCLLALLIPWLGIIYLIISLFTPPRMTRLK
ncbi:hypothetical protein GCM10010912_27600 [Paenibacillus albidus]|uniref:Uncharacterized protein n=1 Tax=Paenibacillus albidus TaxID=2041023 RepID=A0A917CAE3_9BACL|nr:hypothetical protein [Paenibacillus albidus]GGF80992.1 hypothetical protein GCM10010912_27600 [Paenibacillus albidus]